MEVNLMHSIQLAALAPAEFIITGVWQGLVLTAMAWIGLKIFPRISPGYRFLLWMTVFVLAAFLPFFAAFRAPVSAPGLAVRSSGAAASIPLSHLPAAWAVAIAGAWAFASLLSLARLFHNGYSLRLLSRTAFPAPPEALGPEVRSILMKAAPRAIEISLSHRIDSPIVIGFFRRAVVIPHWLFERLTQPELKQVLIHEIAHLERHDDWTNLLQKLLRALFPLNPALLLADRQLCREREMACDDAVLDAAVNPRCYATCLTALAEKRTLQRADSLAPGAWRGRSELAERVHRILGRHRQLGSFGAGTAAAALFLAFLPAGAVLARCPLIVEFKPAAFRPATFAATGNPILSQPVEARLSRPAKFVPASLRTVAAPEQEPRIRHRTAQRVFQRRASSPRLLRPRLLRPHVPQIEEFNLSRQMKDEENSQVILTLWESFSPPDLSSAGDVALPFPNISIFQPRIGWIVIQL